MEGRKMQPIGAVSLVQEPAQDEAVEQVLISLIGERQFDHWFRRKTRLDVVDQELVVYAASPFLQKWMQKQHRTVLAEAARSVIGPAAHVRYELDANLALVSPKTPAASAPRPVVIKAPAAPAAAPIRQGRRFADLADLVVGDCNRLALTAVRQAAERVDGAAGPLFIYGPVGSGKSHLLEGLYRDIRRANPALQVLFLTSEQFTNYFTQGFRDHTLPAFRQRFRTVDVLLVDDVDFLDGKRAVQEEFLHTFQQLESHGKLVVACGDRHPRLLTKISDELKTRFLSGMVCRLELPDLETRERIAASKAGRLAADLSPETLKYVARRFAGSVRELEGALHCLQVYHRMTGRRVCVAAAREVLEDLERDCLKVVRMADIERAVCDMFGVDAADLKSAGRTRSVSEPRMLAMYLARRHTRAAYSEIGQYFGGRNHATVISADRKVAAWLDQNQEVKVASQNWRLKDVLDTLEQQLLAG
jgi:chromosomal replication initiator protein